MMSVVGADGVDHVVDVGFRAGMLYPIPLHDGVVVDQAGWDHRLTRDRARWTLSKRIENGWEALHAFDDTPQRPIDYEVAHLSACCLPAPLGPSRPYSASRIAAIDRV